MALLAQEVVTLCEKGKRSDACQKYEMMNDFFSNHLSLWAPTFADHIVENTNEDFFKGAALALKGVVDGYK